jgi:hypothetical protein
MIMRNLILALAGSAAIAVAAPAYASDTLVTGDPCGVGFVTAAGSSAIACVGYYGSNLLQGAAGSNTPANILADLNTLLTNTPNPPGVQGSTGLYAPPYTANDAKVLATIEGLNGASSFTFGQALTGVTIIGAHFGNNTDSDQNNVTAFWLFNITSPANQNVVFSNGMGSSNAQLFATGTPAVPEPASWALMLLGFGGIGVAMRRGRKQTGSLRQVA